MALAGGGVAAWGGWRQEAAPAARGRLPAPEPGAVPAWFVDREERRRAEDAVCERGSTVGITTSLWGAGGFGKTTLAEMVCAGPRVRKRYEGGVYRFTIGREVRGRADITARVAEITRFVTGDTEQFTDPADAGRHLGRLLDQRKPVLLLLDDVWTAEQLDPFLHGGRQCLRLVTTRVPALLPAGARAIQVDQMTLDQARTVLTWELDDLPPRTTGALLDTTGRWPLLLRLVNRQIRARVDTGQSPAGAAEEVLQELRLHGPQGVDPRRGTVDVDRPEERRRAVSATVEAATGLLPRGGRARFAELAVFAEDEAVPLPLITRLWAATGGLSERDSRLLCGELAGLSLLSLTPENGGRVSLHDVIRDYLLSTHPPLRLAALNRQLPDAAAEGLPDAEPPRGYGGTSYAAWWELEDGYLQDHLIEHLVAGERVELAEAVASDLRWVEQRLIHHGANAPVRDLSQIPTGLAGARARALAQCTHLLAPTDPAPLVLNTLYSRMAFSPPWSGRTTDRLPASPVRPLLADTVSPPDLPDQALLTTLTGHTWEVLSVAISPDATWLASAGDQTVRLWDRVSGACTATLTGHTTTVNTVAISPDGTWLASGDADGAVRLWDRASGSCTATLTGHTARVTSVAISPEGTWLATAGDDAKVRLWSRISGKCIATLDDFDGKPESMAISPDARWLLVCADKKMHRWSPTTGTATFRLAGYAAGGPSLAISPDGAWHAAGSADGTVTLAGGGWCEQGTATGRTVDAAPVTSAAISLARRLGTARRADLTPLSWDPADPRPIDLTGNPDTVQAAAFSADGILLATGDDMGNVRLWDRATGECIGTRTGHTKRVHSVVFSPDGTWLASAGADATVRLWDLYTAPDADASASRPAAGAPRRTTARPRGGPGAAGDAFTGHSGRVSVAVSPDGTWLATADATGNVRLWDRTTGDCTATLFDVPSGTHVSGRTSRVSVAISPDGSWLATSDRPGRLRLWDPAGGLCRILRGGHPLGPVAISPDGLWLAVGDDKELSLWDSRTHRCTAVLTGHTRAVTSVAISPDGTRVATAGEDATVRVWDVASGAYTITVNARRVHSVVFSPDGTWLASAGNDGAVRLWDSMTGQSTAVLTGHADRVNALAVSPDGHWLATVVPGGEIQVWNVHDLSLATLVRTDDELTGCAWAGRTPVLAAAGSRGQHLFELRHLGGTGNRGGRRSAAAGEG
ncbi:NB-ARC domain-containing protein [Streptomyces phytophilus]|uniref:NB-ARC domain-containing protein n=1 Tax=Streptomyces phytophilus TaxID=722715 RepID=UPI0015F0ACE9|nr:NB-ARC domain-containing protein [Streptomyces phytophilus]